jgi:hypothetical protein
MRQEHANKVGETERKRWGLMSHTSRQELFDSRRLPMPEGKGGPTGDPFPKGRDGKMYDAFRGNSQPGLILGTVPPSIPHKENRK